MVQYITEEINLYDTKQAESKQTDKPLTQIQCPACRSYIQINDFGVDRFFYHILSQKIFQNLNDPTLYSGQKIFYSLGSKRYYALNVIGNGKTEILGINYTLNVAPALTDKINAVQNVVIKQAINCLSAADSFGLQQQALPLIKQKAQQVQKQINELVQAKLGLKDNGKDQNKIQRFCFGLQKKLSFDQFQPEPISSILITFHPSLQIWHEYPLQIDGSKDFLYNEAALCLKSDFLPNSNQVFILGGFDRKTKLSSSEFFEIGFPKEAFAQPQPFLNVRKLPKLPYECCLPMGVCYEGKIYLFGGTKYVSPEVIEMNSNVHVFENGQWSASKICLSNPRIDGTIHFNKESQMVALIGGYKIDPRHHKEQDKSQIQVTKIEIISLKNFQCIVIDVNLGLLNTKILTNRCLLAQTGAKELLIFNGISLGENLNQPNFKPYVVNMEYRPKEKEAFFDLNQEYSDRTVYVVDRVGCTALYQMTDVKSQMVIHDYEGVIQDDTFITIYIRPDNLQNQHATQKLQTCAYIYDLGSGKNMYFGYKPFNLTVEKAQSIKQSKVKEVTKMRPFSTLKRMQIVEDEYQDGV